MDFNDALALTLDLEGRTFTNHPKDLGGPTFWGITQSTYDSYLEHRGLTPRLVQTLNPSEIATVYEALFWNQPQDFEGKPIAPQLPSPANCVFFQLAVNRGGEGAVKLLQAALMVEPDGSFGPISQQTLAELKNQAVLANWLLIAQLAHYADVEQPWDAKGLYDRVMKVQEWLKQASKPSSSRSRSASASA